MKKLYYYFTSAILCFAVLLSLPVNVSAENMAEGFDGANTACAVLDTKGVFVDDQQTYEELNQLVMKTSDELDLYIAVFLSDTALNEEQTRIYADEIYEDLFGADTDGVLYYMDLSEQSSAYDYISTSGKAMLYYDGETDSMLDEIFRHLPASGEAIKADQIEDGIRCIMQTFSDYASDSELGFMNYKRDKSKGTYIYCRNGETVVSKRMPAAAWLKRLLFPGIPAGLATALLVFLIVRHRYKFKGGCSAAAYVSHGETDFIRSEDRYIRTRTTKHKIESNSGGSRGGGHSGGSGSHGGGGGHR